MATSYSTARESFSDLTSYWGSTAHQLQWGSIFVLPVWMQAWWEHFAHDTELSLTVVRDGQDIIGIAPLQIEDKAASFAGNPDVCDYMDVIVLPGRETDFFKALLNDMTGRGVRVLELKHLRPDSVVVTKLAGYARGIGYGVSCVPDAVSYEMELPASWEGYLAMLTTKQRHELGRKLRRLGEMGTVSYRTIGEEQAAGNVMDTFLKLFTESRGDKAAFMTPRMESFFRTIVSGTARAGLLRIGVLELDSVPVGMVLCFDYNNIIYLYNSGYDPQYGYLSAGLLSKALCIKDSIEIGKKRFEFLKGGETYKQHLGGKEIPLYSCRITLQ